MPTKENEVDDKIVAQIVKLLREYNPKLTENMAIANVRALLAIGQ